MPYTLSATGQRLIFTEYPSITELVQALTQAAARSLENRVPCIITGLGAESGRLEVQFSLGEWPASRPAHVHHNDLGLYRIVCADVQSPFISLRLPGICWSLSRYVLAIAPAYNIFTSFLTKLFFNIATRGTTQVASITTNEVISRQINVVDWHSRIVVKYLTQQIIPTPPAPYDIKANLISIFGEKLAAQILKEITANG